MKKAQFEPHVRNDQESIEISNFHDKMQEIEAKVIDLSQFKLKVIEINQQFLIALEIFYEILS